MIFLLPGGIEMSVVYSIGDEDGRRKGVSVSQMGVEATFELLDLDDIDLGILKYEDGPPTLRDEEVQALGLGRRADAGRGEPGLYPVEDG
jgi:hypothetical protein